MSRQPARFTAAGVGIINFDPVLVLAVFILEAAVIVGEEFGDHRRGGKRGNQREGEREERKE